MLNTNGLILDGHSWGDRIDFLTFYLFAASLWLFVASAVENCVFFIYAITNFIARGKITQDRRVDANLRKVGAYLLK